MAPDAWRDTLHAFPTASRHAAYAHAASLGQSAWLDSNQRFAKVGCMTQKLSYVKDQSDYVVLGPRLGSMVLMLLRVMHPSQRATTSTLLHVM
jgi:hypothetical protein